LCTNKILLGVEESSSSDEGDCSHSGDCSCEEEKEAEEEDDDDAVFRRVLMHELTSRMQEEVRPILYELVGDALAMLIVQCVLHIGEDLALTLFNTADCPVMQYASLATNGQAVRWDKYQTLSAAALSRAAKLDS
jgi:hypothetical protein